IRRGWSDAAIGGIASGNMIRLWKAVERRAGELAGAERPGVAQVAAETINLKPRAKTEPSKTEPSKT
ncbi:hypothetical protein, partial [Stenotrophomonas maltophilia]|uniref:hypothetical protein n=1 Tax=Stenotrophomonas maltophilia TaxID=40324 RepID=UPI0013DC4828